MSSGMSSPGSSKWSAASRSRPTLSRRSVAVSCTRSWAPVTTWPMTPCSAASSDPRAADGSPGVRPRRIASSSLGGITSRANSTISTARRSSQASLGRIANAAWTLRNGAVAPMPRSDSSEVSKRPPSVRRAFRTRPRRVRGVTLRRRVRAGRNCVRTLKGLLFPSSRIKRQSAAGLRNSSSMRRTRRSMMEAGWSPMRRMISSNWPSAAMATRFVAISA